MTQKDSVLGFGLLVCCGAATAFIFSIQIFVGYVLGVVITLGSSAVIMGSGDDFEG